MAESATTQKRNAGNTEHDITLVSRKQMRITGVRDIIGFDGCYVELDTVCGRLYVDGENIKIGALDTDSGVVALGVISVPLPIPTASEKKRKAFSRGDADDIRISSKGIFTAYGPVIFVRYDTRCGI